MLVDREEFTKTLTRVKPALGKGGTIVALAHFWFDKKALFAFNGGFGIRLDYKSELECGLPGGPLLGLLGTSALKETGLDQNGSSVAVKFGKSSTKLAALEAGAKVWPYPGKLPRGAEATALGEEFIEALRKTLFVKASVPTRVEHHGVMVQKVKNDLELFATDSATIAAVKVRGAGKGAAFERALLPREFAEQLVSQSPEGAEFYVLKDCLIAEAEGVAFYSNVLDLSAADDMGAIMARKEGQHPAATPLPAGLEGALARAEVLAGVEEPVVVLEVEGTSLKVTGEYALGTLNEALTLEAKAPAAKFRAKAGLLRRALTHAEAFSIEKGSLLLRGEPDFRYLVASL